MKRFPANALLVGLLIPSVVTSISLPDPDDNMMLQAKMMVSGDTTQQNVMPAQPESNATDVQLFESSAGWSVDPACNLQYPGAPKPACKKYCYGQVKKGKKWPELCAWDDCSSCDCCKCENFPPETDKTGCKKYCYNQVKRGKSWDEICAWGDCSSCGCCIEPSTTTTTTPPYRFKCDTEACALKGEEGREWVDDLCLLDTCNDCPKCCSLKWNTREKLSPPAGTLWRGAVVDKGKCFGVDGATQAIREKCLSRVNKASCDKQNKVETRCHWVPRFTTYQEWRAKYGFPLHMKRVFKGNGWSAWEDDEISFMKSGGIIFFSIAMKPPGAFTDWNRTEGRYLIKEFADVIKQAPVMEDGTKAKVLATVRYEQDHWSDPHNLAKFMGTPFEYRKMFADFAQVFADEGVDNVVWSVDYSASACTEDKHPLLAHLWPGEVQIDWLFWNIFQFGKDKKRSFSDMFNVAYSKFEELSGSVQSYKDEKYSANYKDAVNWGLGAWGANFEPKLENEEEKRAEFIHGLSEALNSDKYPRLKAHVYFDTEDPNAGSGSVIREGQEAVYKELNANYKFVRNDNESWCP